MLDEFYRVAFRKKIFRSIAELQADLDAWVESYNEEKAAPGATALRQDANADLPRRHAACKGAK